MDLRVAGSFFALLVASVSLAETAAAQSPGRITRESVDSSGGELLGHSSVPSLSADGRYVAFQSDAADVVPQDTNGDTDIFVRDRQTGVVQRVSLAWNGMEARDDSACPSLSADGRFVAFASRAWNMYPGGANLGSPRWDVYVRDRQDESTVRLTVASGGGDPNGDSGCPKISGDGSLIVFASEASNFVAGDTNGYPDVFLVERATGAITMLSVGVGGSSAASVEPAISRDGSVVAFASRANNLVTGPPMLLGLSNIFAVELATGDIELISRSTTHPVTGAGHDSRRPVLSADGRYVAFESWASNLVDHNTNGKVIYVRDRVAGTTSAIGVQEPTYLGCGANGDAYCSHGTSHAPAISDDGRFVAFASGSKRLLPANLIDYGTSIYLADRVGGRLRRLSTDATGLAGEACSEEPAISADGKLVAFRTASTGLIADDTNGADDVLSNAWTCDAEGRCRTLASCPAAPLDACEETSGSVLRLRKHPPRSTQLDRFFWRWSGPASAGAFPDPDDAGLYQLCVYGKTLALDVAAPDADECDDAERPCWKTLQTGYKLLEPDGGLSSLRLTTGGGVARIVARGSGPLLDAPYLPLAAPAGIVVQLQDTGSGRCWSSAFPTSSIKRNIGGVSTVGSLRNGQLSAQID